MAKVSSLVVLVLTFAVLAQAMHLHPHGGNILKDEGDEVAEIDGIPIDELQNIKQTRFVPVNSVLFFKSFSACEDGYERDLYGVCREVW